MSSRSQWPGLSLLVASALILFSAGAGFATERFALVIGNGAYDAAAVPRLENPVADAELIASRLELADFDVTLVTDGDLRAMTTAVAAFGRALRQAPEESVALFFYAGHAVQSFQRNYLLPVDAALTDPADLDFVALEAASILRQMSSGQTATNIVILDACRNNPFDTILPFNENGLAEMRAPTGTFLSYATAPGEVAYDGAGAHSPFTAELSEEMLVPGAPIEEVFRNVRIDVLDATAGRQTPWDTSSLTREFTFVEASEPSANGGGLVFAAPSAEEVMKSVWDRIAETRDPAQIELYVTAYPSSPYVDDALALLDQMQETPASAPSAPSETNLAARAVPGGDELARLEEARAAADAPAYEAFLRDYPDGTFAELARSELAALAANASKDPDAANRPPEREVAALPPADAPAPPTPGLTFTSPLQEGDEAILGRSIAELIAGNPLFPPVEGLPESFWAERTCANCHQWEAGNLCEQAGTYLKRSAEEVGAKAHPYGGSFKTTLRAWAAAGCPS